MISFELFFTFAVDYKVQRVHSRLSWRRARSRRRRCSRGPCSRRRHRQTDDRIESQLRQLLLEPVRKEISSFYIIAFLVWVKPETQSDLFC